jgi:hypothetical protein
MALLLMALLFMTLLLIALLLISCPAIERLVLTQSHPS